MSLTTILRQFRLGSDRTLAVEAERAAFAREEDRVTAFDERLVGAFSSEAAGTVMLGEMTLQGKAVRVPAEKILGHWGFWGPSGAGKSYLLVLVIIALVRAGVRSLIVLDPKSETVSLLSRALAGSASEISGRHATIPADRVVLIDPYSSDSLPQLQVLLPEAGIASEVQGYDIANLITSDLDMTVGIRQESVLNIVISALIAARLPLTVLPRVLMQPEIFEALAEQTGDRHMLLAATRLRREPPDRIAGLVSRAERLLRLRSTRLALSAEGCLDFDQMLEGRIVLVNLEPPHGSTDIGRVVNGLIWTRLQHAIRRRPNGAAPAFVVLEEAPAFLNAGGSRAAEAVEDLLRLSRSKGVYFIFLAQELAALNKSSTLANVVRNNCHVHCFFRTNDDWSFALPVTGRRSKPPAPPWEEQRPGFLERGAELALLREELARLPDRHCYFLDRRSGLPAVLMRTADVVLDASEEQVQSLRERATHNDAVLPVAELERAEAAVEERLSTLLRKSEEGACAESAVAEVVKPKPRRPKAMPSLGREPVDIG